MTEILRYAAFTSDPAAGNPAGVVLDSDLTKSEMQSIAADIGYSETAFLSRQDAAEVHRYTLRYFSPRAEVAFCGHATIAAAVALARRGATGTLQFETEAGEVDVALSEADGNPLATLTSVETASMPVDSDTLAETLKTLDWSLHDLDPDFPAHVAFAGNNHLILAAGTRERLEDLDYDFDALDSVMERQQWTTVQLFWQESAGLIHSRNPFPVGGVVEDPATGAAAAALGGYLMELGRVTSPREILIVQGESMGRRSELTLTLTPGERRSRVSGTAVEIL